MLNWLRSREHYRPDNSQFTLSVFFRCSSRVLSRASTRIQGTHRLPMIGKYVVPMQTLFIIKDFMQCYVFTYSCKLLAYRITLLKKQFTAEKFEVFENYYF